MFRKYWERNLSVIPVKGKRPFLPGWSKYCDVLPTEAEIDEWERLYKFPEYGVGLCCGRASKLIFIDWDTESPDIKSLVPLSPVIRVGAKGGGSAFQFNEKIPSIKVERDNLGTNKHLKEKEGVEFLTTGRMIVLPPSIHPDTKKSYFWQTLDTLDNYDVCNLPVLHLENVNEIVNHIKCFANTTKDGKNLNLSEENNLTGSRNGRLTQVVCAIIAQHSYKSDEEIAKEIYEHDEREFGAKAYFKAKDRQHNQKARGNASLAALYFVKEHRERMIKKGLATRTEIITVGGDAVLKTSPAPFPESDGLIHAIKESIMRCSRSSGQDELATGAAIAICSTLASNRFHIGGVAALTHQYIMCVARTGKGKGAAVKVANGLFMGEELAKYNLSGLSNYSSNAAFVEHLAEQRSRLDIIDEFGTILKGLSGGSDLKKEMEGFFCSIYSDKHFKGHNTKGQNNQGKCIYPAVTIFANVQDTTLMNYATSSMLESGFLARFMHFSAREDTPINPTYLDALDLSEIGKECARIFPFYKLECVAPDGSIITDIGSIEPRREPLVMDRSVKSYKFEMDEFFYNRDQNMLRADNRAEATLQTRQFEMLERLAITNAVCCDRRELLNKDYDYAFAVVSACLERSKGYYSIVGSNSKFEREAQKILSAVRKAGKVSHSKLLRNSHMNSRDFQSIIATLLERQSIGQVLQGAGSKAKEYAIINN